MSKITLKPIKPGQHVTVVFDQADERQDLKDVLIVADTPDWAVSDRYGHTYLIRNFQFMVRRNEES